MRNYAELLDPIRLTSAGVIDAAVQTIQRDITETNCVAILKQILSARQPKSIAVLLSGIGSDIPIESWILNNFPWSATDYVTSPFVDLLTNLSEFFTSNQLHAGHRETSLRLRTINNEVVVCTAAIRSFGATKDVSTKQIKKKTNIQVGKGHAEKTLNEEEVLIRQKSLLEGYLQVLRAPEIWDEIKAILIHSYHPRGSLEMGDNLSALPQGEEASQETPTWAGLSLQPSQLNESIEQFGLWPIMISGRADRNLREARRRDKKGFLILLKKIRDLSTGDFSGDNQIRINRGGDIVPVFQAKASFHARLVYQVDCLPRSTNEEIQSISIFGVYTPTELRNQVWDAVGKQLARRGKEYKDRCTVRVSSHLDQRHFVPASFPPITEEPTADNLISDLLQVSDHDEIQSILILQKFVPFSRALLYSILADLDALFPFELSLKEKTIVEYPYSCYVLGRGGTGKTTTMLQRMVWIERSSQINTNGELKARQLFVTKSAALAQKVEEYFQKMLESIGMSTKSPDELRAIAGARRRAAEGNELLDNDEDHTINNSLPSRFGELEDRHFPLFIGFDELCALLEGDIAEHRISCHRDHDALAPQNPRGNFVSDRRFLRDYWSHFNQALVKGLDPRTVYGELVGVIEGSELTVSSPERCLDFETYDSLSERANPTFSTTRAVIYELFRSYRKRKKELHDYDNADRTHTLLHSLHSLHKCGMMEKKLDYLYVDEVQDNLMIDALLLRSICRNPNGLFWAGDTAQTISSGCSFRFQDLKAMLYRMEQQAKNVSHGSEPGIPRTFFLAVNYRSHSGIVDCARSVVELIHQHWPYSIDAFAPETGLIVGPPPIFLTGDSIGSTQLEKFLFGGGDDSVELGAHQCILVRNDTTRKKLRETVGEIGIILTIYQSKGLEFDAVLLYDFFLDSPLGAAQWRLLLRDDASRCPTQSFDSIKHAGLCNELKSLYVAITRAKKNMWIADCSENAIPMKNYWSQRNVVKVFSSHEMLPRVAGTSTTEQWADIGRVLFARKDYSEAAICFKRASLLQEEAIASAYDLRDSAEKQPLGRPGSASDAHRQAAFYQAANALLSCANITGTSSYFCRSAECFEEAGALAEAAKAYHNGGDFTKTVSIYHRLSMFDEAMAVIHDNRRKVSRDVVLEVTEEAKVHYLKQVAQDFTALQKVRPLFTSGDNEMIEYSAGIGLNGTCATILRSLGRLLEASDYLVKDGRQTEAIELLLQDETLESTKGASRLIINALWKEMPFGLRLDAPALHPVVDGLLCFSRRLRTDNLGTDDRKKLEMFHALHCSDITALVELGKYFFKNRDSAAAVQCFGGLYMNMKALPPFRAMQLHELATTVDAFQMYVESLSSITHMNPASPTARQLFGLEVRKQGHGLSVPRNTFLYDLLTDGPGGDDSVTLNGLTSPLYKTTLGSYLEQLVYVQCDTCLKARALDPCINYVVKRNCTRDPCERDHLDRWKLDKTWYNHCIRIHLLQISTLQSLASVPQFKAIQRVWVNRLYHTLHPLHYHFGSFSDLDLSSIPGVDRHVQALNLRTRDDIYDLRLVSNDAFLTSVLIYIDLRISFDRNDSKLPSVEYLCPEDNVKFRFRNPVSLLLNSGNGSWPSVVNGTRFSKHVVDHSLPIDLSVFCSFLDRLCGLAIIRESRNYHRGAIHDVLLPQRWWLKVTAYAQGSRNDSDPRNEAFRTLYNVLLSLLQQMLRGDFGSPYSYRHNKGSNMNTFWARVLRLCRAICLLCHNAKTNQLREDILAQFRQLRLNFNAYVPFVCNMYLTSYSWQGIVRALGHSTQQLQGEQLLLVCKRNMYYHNPQWQWHRRVIYDEEQDLRLALQSEEAQTEQSVEPKLFQGSTGESEKAATERPHSPLPQDTETVSDMQMGDGIGEEPVEEEEDQEESPLATMQYDAFTEGHERAANVIKKAWRRYLKRRKAMECASVEGADAFFSECLQQSEEMEWPRRSFYKRLYLGPLPHVLFCLKTLEVDIHREKVKMNKQFREGEGDDIDKASKVLTDIQSHTKELSHLKKALCPTAEVHQHQDHDILKALVEQAAKVIEAYPSAERDWNLGVAVKGIVRERVGEEAPRELELQEEDGMEDYDNLY